MIQCVSVCSACTAPTIGISECTQHMDGWMDNARVRACVRARVCMYICLHVRHVCDCVCQHICAIAI